MIKVPLAMKSSGIPVGRAAILRKGVNIFQISIALIVYSRYRANTKNGAFGISIDRRGYKSGANKGDRYGRDSEGSRNSRGSRDSRGIECNGVSRDGKGTRGARFERGGIVI